MQKSHKFVTKLNFKSLLFSPSLKFQRLELYHKLNKQRRRRRMSDENPTLLKNELYKRTSIFGLHLWVVLGICVGAAIVIILLLISLWLTSRRNKKTSHLITHKINSIIPNVSREIQVDPTRSPKLLPPPPVTRPIPEPAPNEDQRIHIEVGKGHRIAYPVGPGPGSGSCETRAGGEPAPEVSHLGWGHWYTLRELEEATNGFAENNVIGEGGYGIVYHGLLADHTRVAVKNLLNNR